MKTFKQKIFWLCYNIIDCILQFVKSLPNNKCINLQLFLLVDVINIFKRIRNWAMK
jgi:hypothetical protein